MSTLPPQPWTTPEITSIGREPAHAIVHDERLSLDGEWDFELLPRPDAPPTGHWRPITVPGVWTMQDTADRPQYLNIRMPFGHVPPHVPEDNPTGRYRRTMTIPEEWSGRRIVLHVGAAESVLLARVNDTEVGVSKDSHLAAEFDVTSVLTRGPNTVELTVVKWSDASFIEDQDQWWHGGITRSVYLYATSPVYLRDLHVVADLDPRTHHGSLVVTVNVGAPDGLIPAGLTVRTTLAGTEVALSDGVPTRPAYGAGIATGGDHAGVNVFSLHDVRSAGLPLTAELEAMAKRFAEVQWPQAGVVTMLAEVGPVRPWSAEEPHLYDLTVSLADAHGTLLDQTGIAVGFRRVEIVGQDLLVNGRRIWVQGVNRHDFDPRSGRTVTRDQMAAELAQLKRFNVNAIRTSHYPPDPALLELADAYGFYVVDEANIEAHDWARQVCDDPRYLTAFVDRVSRMARRDKNHPSVIMWSLGNETGSGTNHDAAAGWVRGFDPTRPLHYEGAINGDWHTGHAQTDVVCPMYSPIEAIVGYATDERADRPLILCEYQHAMGNSNGSFDDYWRAIRTTPGLQGGFVWELWDHGLDPDCDGRYRYGGDFGEDLHDGNFCIDGLLFPDGTPHPAMYELRRTFTPVEIASAAEDLQAGVLRLRNEQAFADLGWLQFRAQVVTASGVSSATPLSVAAAAGEIADVALPDPLRLQLAEDGALGLRLSIATSRDLPWAAVGSELAVLQLNLRKHVELVPDLSVPDLSAPSGPPVRLGAEGLVEHELLARGPQLCLWRALTDNDLSTLSGTSLAATGLASVERSVEAIEWSADRSRATIQSSHRGTTGPVIGHTQTVRSLADGSLAFEETVVVPDAFPDIPRVGLVLETVPGFEAVTWLGDGPHETYPDRRAAALHGRWTSTATDLSVPYLRPQENGGRANVSCLELGDGERTVSLAFDRGMQVSASHHRIADLETAGHWWELDARAETIVHLDVAHRGLGTASVGPDPDPRFLVGPGTYRWSWTLSVPDAPTQP